MENEDNSLFSDQGLQNNTENIISNPELEQGSVTQEQVDNITREVIESMIKSQQEEQIESTSEENNETSVDLTFLDPRADHHLYLSSEVEFANLNDIYSIALSIRNIILLLVLVLVGWKLFNLCKSAIYKMFNM